MARFTSDCVLGHREEAAAAGRATTAREARQLAALMAAEARQNEARQMMAARARCASTNAFFYRQPTPFHPPTTTAVSCYRRSQKTAEAAEVAASAEIVALTQRLENTRTTLEFFKRSVLPPANAISAASQHHFTALAPPDRIDSQQRGLS